MNNPNVGGKNYPIGYTPQQQPIPQQQVYTHPVAPQQQPMPPMYQQPPVQPVYQQPAASAPQPVRPVYQQPIMQTPQTVRQTPPYTVAAKSAVGSMNRGLFVVFSVLFGWICSRSLFSMEFGVGMTVMGLAFYLIYIPFMLFKQKKKFSLSGWLLFIPQIIILASFTFFSDMRVTLIGLAASLVIAAIQTTLLSGCSIGKPFSFELLCDTCINYFAMPIMNLGTTLAGLFGKKNKTSLKIAIGAAISLPVVFILIMIFAFADEMFARWVSKIITVLNINPFRIAADILITIIVMLYVMPLVVSLRSGYHKQYNHKESRRFFDPIITATVLFASSVVYLVFVAVQFTYLFAGLGSLPKGLNIAEYSRRGFFELVFVIVITTIVIAGVCVLTKNNQRNCLPVYVKVALLIITASNAVIIVSAARRLIIYIGEYNLTLSRFNAAVLIALMAVVDIVIALRIIFDHLRVSAVIGSILAMTAAAYCICNVDGLVAKFNVDRYFENPAKYKVDVNYLSENLSVAAIPQLERLMNEAPEERVKVSAKYGIAHLADEKDLFTGDETKIARWTLDRQVAVNIIEKEKITRQMADEYWSFYWSHYSNDL